MGRDKGLLPVGGVAMAERVFSVLSPLFSEVLLAGAPPGRYPFLPCRTAADRFPGEGPLAGLHGALLEAAHPAVLLVPCDLPFLSPALLRLLAETYLSGGGATGAPPSALVPCSPRGPEPLCAIYGKGCLPEVESALAERRLSISALLPRLPALLLPAEAVAKADPSFRSFRNVNTAEEYERIAGDGPA
jgi:molybdopterin-guanine dinucleotide biosynthesis protein A